MKLKYLILAVLLMLSGNAVLAQTSRNVFSFTDSLMRNSRIGRAGKQMPRPVEINYSAWEPLPSDGTRPDRFASDEQDFVLYLLDRGLKEDALTLLAQPFFVPSDTLDYLRGLALFEDHRFDAADRWFSASSLEPSLFYASSAKAFVGRGRLAVPRLESYEGRYGELRDLQLGGLALLDGNTEGYRACSAAFSYADHTLAESERALDEIARSLESHRSKHPWAAAVLSTVLPGAGQLYAGSLGEAVSSFVTVGALGAVTAANWHKYGAKSWRTIAAGTVCAAFYIGNIYGAWVSVGIHEQQFKDETSAMLMYHIYIPVRNVFR